MKLGIEDNPGYLCVMVRSGTIFKTCVRNEIKTLPTQKFLFNYYTKIKSLESLCTFLCRFSIFFSVTFCRYVQLVRN